jgi:MFS family permease
MARLRVLLTAVGVALGNPAVRRAQLAWGAVIAAEWAHFVALGVYAYDRGGASAVGIAGLVRLLPAGLIAPFAASLGDRFRRERFLVVAALVGAASLAASAAAAASGARAAVFAFAAVTGLASTLVRPALQALLPSLARTSDELIASNATTSTVESLGTLVGPLLGGVLVAAASASFVFGCAGATMAAAALVFASVRVEGRAAPADEKPEAVAAMLWAGFKTIARESSPRLLIALGIAQCFVRGCLNVLIVVATFRLLHGSGADVGYLTAAIGVGGFAGAIGAAALAERRLAATFGVALLLWGVPIALLAPRPYLALMIAILAVVGAANSVEDVAIITLLQRLTPDHLLTRILGLLWGLAMGAVAVGSIAAPLLIDLVGLRATFALVGSALALLTVLAYRRLVEIDRAAVPGVELGLIGGVPMFAPLSLATKEQLAANLVPMSVPAGTLVVRAGDEGDRFFIVGSGQLDVDAPGVHATVGDGGFFGEIALLRDVVRTASVRARTDAHLYALEREPFVAAVTGHATAHARAGEVAAARIAGTA